jgi:hypothetical protein
LIKCIFTNDETLEASIEVAHYGDIPIKSCKPEWKITDTQGQVIKSGKLKSSDIALGNCIPLGKISLPLSNIVNAQQLKLEVSVDSFSNSWDFWVYPASKNVVAGSEKIKVVTSLDPSTRQFLEQGGSVLLTLKKGTLRPEYGGKIAIGFSSIFWNTAWTKGQPPHTLGILCNPNHPALAGFPTEYHSNWQWWDAMSHSGAINLTSLPSGIRPIVRVVDDWFTNRPLALIFEAKAGKGKILISGIDLTTNLGQRPEARQLLFSLQNYMTGERFNPKNEVNPESIQNLTGM